jgi:hypothetical protein
MIKWVYKADNAYGIESTGTVAAHTLADARLALRDKGLVSTYLEDSRVYKKKRRARRRRQRLLIRTGAVLILGAVALAGWMHLQSQRPVAPQVSAMLDSGVLQGSGGTVVANTKEAEKFAHFVVQSWDQYTPGLVNGIELRKNIMTLHITSKAVRLKGNELQSLSTTTVKALQREFEAPVVTMLLVQDDLTMMELYYNAYTKKTKVQDYR